MTWYAQVKYGHAVAESAADGWVTVGISDDATEAARHAAFDHRNEQHPDNGRPEQFRLRSTAQLRAQGGEEALSAARDSMRRLAERPT